MKKISSHNYVTTLSNLTWLGIVRISQACTQLGPPLATPLYMEVLPGPLSMFCTGLWMRLTSTSMVYIVQFGMVSAWLTFMAHSAYKHHETFSFMMSFLSMSFGDRFCFSRKGRIRGEVGGCTQRAQTAWPHLGSAIETTWLALGGPFLSFLAWS